MTASRSPVGPVDERGPPLRRQHAAGRVLVGRRHEHGVDVRGVEPVDQDAGVVDRDRDDRQPALDDDRAVLGVRRVLDGQPRAPRARQRPRDEPEALGEPGATTTTAGLDGHPADAVEVRRRARSGAPGRRARRGSERRSAGASASTRRIERSQAARGNSVTSGRPGRKSNGHERHRERRRGRPACRRATARPGSRRPAAPRGSPRRRAARTPRRRSRATRRAGPRARGSRAGSSRPPAGRRGSPERRFASSCRWSGSATSRSSGTSSSTSELVLDLAIEPDLSRGPVSDGRCGQRTRATAPQEVPTWTACSS